MKKYTSYLKAPFFANGEEVFETGYVSKAQALREARAYVADQYDKAERPKVSVRAAK
jgi:hypothetical protein